MKTLVCACLCLCLVQASIEASATLVTTTKSISTCGVADGFAVSTGLSAGIVALLPGGQGAAVILAITAASIKLAKTMLC